MSREPWGAPNPDNRGFTLIEVIAALVIFSMGVLMVIDLTEALSEQMKYAATTSELVVRAEERLDSLESLDFDSLTLGSTYDTLNVQGIVYQRTQTVSSVTGLLYQLQISLAPTTSGLGPSYSATSYSAAKW